MPRPREPEPIRITTVSSGRNADIAARQRRYLISMGIRTICFAGAAASAIAGIAWLWPILIVLALVLPYVAVVMANAANTKGTDDQPLESPYGQLPPGRGQ